jgi:UDP-N-acetylglucosamine--N-acetylmuramyl-(pentapeptide) pyrophosphoryl-undecaprenol N-acetylglucosamine transferase
VNPALAVWHALAADDRLPLANEPSASVLWVGGLGGMEADLVKREGIPFEAIPAAGVHGVGLRALPGNLWQLGRGLLAARQILRRFRPDALLFTGGYVAPPLALAARLPGLGFRRPRSLLYVPDIEPGLALKVLMRFSDHIALTAEDSRAFLPPRAHASVTGYPVRPGLNPIPVEAARRALGLQPDLPTLLVWGGSKGARSINRALIAALPRLLAEMQVIHLSGQLDWPAVQATGAALTPEQAARYRSYPYLHEEMIAALSAADLVVSRAGASVLGEYPQFGLPAILAPYPYAWRYQRVNADALAQRGAAVVLEDADLGAQLLPRVQELMGNPARREIMRQAMRALAQPQAAGAIARILIELAGARQEGQPA